MQIMASVTARAEVGTSCSPVVPRGADAKGGNPVGPGAGLLQQALHQGQVQLRGQHSPLGWCLLCLAVQVGDGGGQLLGDGCAALSADGTGGDLGQEGQVQGGPPGVGDQLQPSTGQVSDDAQRSQPAGSLLQARILCVAFLRVPGLLCCCLR